MIRQCVICGTEYEAKSSRKTCSRECFLEYNRQYKREHQRQGKSYICKNCGIEFVPKAADRITFCGQACSTEHQKEQAALRKERLAKEKLEASKKPCTICGKVFIVKRGDQKYCSNECRLAANKVLAVKYAREMHKKSNKQYTCKICGKVFMPEYGNKQRAFCSDECKREQKRRQKKVQGHNHRSRAKYHGVIYENVSLNKVYEKHGWRCGICGELINKTLVSPHPMSATIDHIIPMAKGGGHVMSNLQPAHRICNSKKRDLVDYSAINA